MRLHWNSCKFESDPRRESFLDKNTISWQGHLELMSGNHTCTNSLGRGLKDYVGCHCKGKHCHCHLVGCYRHCHSVGCHNKKKHFHQVGCHYSKFGWVSSLSGGGVIVPVGSLVCSTCSLSSHITMLKAHKKSFTSPKMYWPGPTTKL